MTKTAFVAGIFSMILVGTTTTTAEADTSSSDNDGVIEILGKTLCTAKAPAAATCDWRIPDLKAPAKPRHQIDSFSLFGQRFCLAGADGPCDHRIAGAPAPRQRSLSLLGIDVCFGSGGPSCDVTIPPPRDDRRASL